MSERYEIRLMGRLGPVLSSSFDGMQCVCVSGRTVIRGRLSGPDLDRLLELMDKFGLTVFELQSTAQ